MIGLLGSDQYWQGLLDQEGVRPIANSLSDTVRPALLVLDRVPSRAEALAIAEYVRGGGTVLTGARAAIRVWPELRPSRRRIRYILPDGSPFFRNVGLVDLETIGWQLPEARYGQTDAGHSAIVARQIAQGWLVVLPFEPTSVLADVASRPRRFFADTPYFPSETVSRVGRGEIRRLVANCIRWLLNQQGLPYVHLAYLPSGHTSLLGLRVDTDFASGAELETTAELAQSIGMRFSWFVNVGHHRDDLGFFRALAQSEHEVGLHCLRHTISHSDERNRDSFGRARQAMQNAGLDSVGVAAPYGQWNPRLGRVFEELGFDYSSEFSYAYDDLPSRPVLNGRIGRLLQIPVHPICTGRLFAARAVRHEVVRYFCRYLDLQVARQEPCLLYDHPGQLAQEFAVWREVLGYGLSRCGAWTTMVALARFWQRRGQAGLRVNATQDLLDIVVQEPADDCPVVVERDGRYAVLAPVTGQYQLAALSWFPLPEPAQFDPAIAQTRRPSVAYQLRELHRRLVKYLQSRHA